MFSLTDLECRRSLVVPHSAASSANSRHLHSTSRSTVWPARSEPASCLQPPRAPQRPCSCRAMCLLSGIVIMGMGRFDLGVHARDLRVGHAVHEHCEVVIVVS